MTDFLTPSARSYLMSRVRGKNTRIERLIFGELRKRGVPFSKHARGLEGRPDIVCRSCRLAIFVDGDFWHGRRYEAWQHKLTARWSAKIEANMRRDRRQRAALRRRGWHVLKLWGSDILKDPPRCAEKVIVMRARLLRGKSEQ
jgi:DNA mismatch endonuclease (patch repair protein)